MEVIERQKGKHFVKVFTFEGEPVTQVSTKAWYKALKRAGIENFRWHDLRHTWASWHVQSGTLLHVLQELGGWQTATMVRRYAHLAVEHLAAYVGRTNIHGTNMAQPAESRAAWRSDVALKSRKQGNLVGRVGVEPTTKRLRDGQLAPRYSKPPL